VAHDRFPKIQGFSWLGEQLLASGKELYCIEFVSYLLVEL
jgi:hypothetical protein